MNDLVERLRHPKPEGGGFRLRGEAALEIERLRAALVIARECLGACIGTPDWYRAKEVLDAATQVERLANRMAGDAAHDRPNTITPSEGQSQVKNK